MGKGQSYVTPPSVRTLCPPRNNICPITGMPQLVHLIRGRKVFCSGLRVQEAGEKA